MARIKPQFTAVFKKTRAWYVGWIEELPGVNTQGKTLKEAKENLQDALDIVLEHVRKSGRTAHGSQGVFRSPITPSAYL